MNRTEAAKAIGQAASGFPIRAACASPVDCLTLIDAVGVDFSEQDAAEVARMVGDREYFRARGGWERFDTERQTEKIARILDTMDARGLRVETVDAWENGGGYVTISLTVTKAGAQSLADYFDE